VESIACSQFLPAGIHSLLDYGSGAGFPGIPIALCRPEIAVTLAESQVRKAAFLREVERTLELKCRIWGWRAEELGDQFHCVVLRAVDRMEDAVAKSAELVRPGGWLAIMTTQSDLEVLRSLVGREFGWLEPRQIPGSEQRILEIGSKKGVPE
jgi:16S rRNA (guanine527-N7)-methyltransferase